MQLRLNIYVRSCNYDVSVNMPFYEDDKQTAAADVSDECPGIRWIGSLLTVQ